MAKLGFIVFCAILLAVSFQEANAVKCWRCSSDSSSAAFCDDPFDSSIVTEQQRRYAYVDCSRMQLPSDSYKPGVNLIPVCKKLKQKINDKIVVTRSCEWEDQNSPRDSCQASNTPSYITNEYCQTCTTDLCNGAGQLYGSIAAFVVIPILIAKFLIL